MEVPRVILSVTGHLVVFLATIVFINASIFIVAFAFHVSWHTFVATLLVVFVNLSFDFDHSLV